MKYLLVPDRAPQFYNVADDPQEQRDLYFPGTRMRIPSLKSWEHT